MAKEKRIETFRAWFARSNSIRWMILFVIAAVLTLILYPSLGVPKRQYNIGDIAERDIKAPREFFIEDKDVTVKNRKKAIESILTVYDYNTDLLVRLKRNVTSAFRELRKIAEEKVEPPAEINPQENEDVLATIPLIPPKSVHERIWDKKPVFEKTLGITVSNGAYSILEKENFSEQIVNLINQLLTKILENGVVANKEVLLLEADHGILLREVRTKEETVERNLKHFYGLDQAKTMVRVLGEPLLEDVGYTLKNLIVDFCQRLIQPNITLNRSETEERKQAVAAEIKPVLYKIKAGEMILREGERITEKQLLKLNRLRSSIREERIYATAVGATMLMLTLLVVTYLINYNHRSFTAGNENKNLIFMATVIILFVILAEISASVADTLPRQLPYAIAPSSIAFMVPVASSAMIICLFMGLEIAVAFSLVICVCVTVVFNNRFELFIYYFLNSTMGAYWIQHCRERKVFVKAGFQLACLNVLLASAVNLFVGDFIGIQLLWDLAFAFLGGIIAGIITAGMAPLVETAFGFATDITLLELANLERPILRRLMIEAPGTYHHSVIVGSMVEAAATEIGANPLLAKVCGYYHDIGKIKKPLYFIENQSSSKNPHDKLAPSMSRRILIAHVKEGVEIGKEHRLAQVIIDAIQQHHGTSLIKYFHDKAVKLQGEKAVKAEDFRYPGPLPQTREAGLVMLADVVEAASRTLDNPTPARIQGLVQNLVNKIFSDGQLDDCELTLKDLHSIAKIYNKILTGIHHHRIEYSEKSPQQNGKSREMRVINGDSNRQQTKEKKDSQGSARKNDPGHLKRLGLS